MRLEEMVHKLKEIKELYQSEVFKPLAEFLMELDKDLSNGFLLQEAVTPIEEVAALRAKFQVVNLIKNLPQALEESKKRIDKAAEIQAKMAASEKETY